MAFGLVENRLAADFSSFFRKILAKVWRENEKIEKRVKDSNPFVKDSNPFQTKTLDLYSDKEWHFCSCFKKFLAWFIFEKNEDKVQKLLK